MSTLSKVFVVLVLLAAAAFAMTSIAHLATIEDFKGKFDTADKALTAAKKEVATLTQDLTVEKNNHTDTKTKLGAQIATLDGNLKTLTTAKESVDLELKNLKVDLTTNTANLAAVKSSLDSAVADNKNLSKDLDTAQKARDEALEKKRDAEQGLMDSQNQVKILKEDQQAKEKQIYELMVRVKALTEERDRLAALVGVQPKSSTGEKTPLIEAVVTNVQRSENDTLVQLSVGSTSDVKAGMIFIVFGAEGYKADIQIMTVEANASVGKVIASSKPVAKGDRAKTQLQATGV